MDYEKLIEELLSEFKSRISLSSITLSESDIKIEILPPSHQQKGTKLSKKEYEDKKVAAYLFFLNDLCLKVGMAGTKSYPRVASHHYSVNAPSTLLGSILLDEKDFGVNYPYGPDPVVWMKNNLTKINIFINKEPGENILKDLETFLQRKLKPKYEGRS